MAKNKKPRKAYNPRKVLCDSSPMFRYSKEQADALKLRIYYHLSRAKTGVGNGADYNALMYRLRVGSGLLDHFTNPDAEELVTRAMVIVKPMLEQLEARGVFGFIKPADGELVHQALAVIDDIHDSTTRIEQLPIHDRVYNTQDHTIETRYP